MRWLMLVVLLGTASLAFAQDAPNRRIVATLDDFDPYYPNHRFPKLTTPQWVGEDGVEAVVVLAIDDLRDSKRYEAYLRPILRRLKEIDGRAPVSIMTCTVNPQDPLLQTWLKEGLSLECHTYDHPCPFFKNGFAHAKETYEKCVDLLAAVPNSKPVAFRMPCCDSMNTPSPRFWAEIFNKTTPKGNFLTIDSSVFNVFTSADPELPKELVLDEQGRERFVKYLPKDRSFVNTIENYPYPYVIGNLCWEFPCMTPSDWQAQHLHKPNNPQTVKDWNAALDCTVVKQGVFCMVFHPHGWIKADQVVEFIDHAVKKHGKKVKFLTFKECQERLNKNLFDGRSLRDLREKAPFGSPLTYGEGNKYMSVAYERGQRFVLKAWDNGRWKVGEALALRDWPPEKVPGFNQSTGLFFRTIDIDKESDSLGLFSDGVTQRFVWYRGRDTGPQDLAKLSLPPGARLIDEQKRDAGLRFIDLDGDGKLDVLFSNEKEYGIYLFKDLKEGWSRKVMAGKQGEPGALPPIARHGTNNGFWVHSGQLWWSNEDTVLLKDHVDRRNIKKLLSKQATK